jgi:hypothetical protein
MEFAILLILNKENIILCMPFLLKNIIFLGKWVKQTVGALKIKNTKKNCKYNVVDENANFRDEGQAAVSLYVQFGVGSLAIIE